MSHDKAPHRNDIGRWIMLALICAGGSTGGGMLRGHNPGITTEAWIKLQIDVAKTQLDVEALRNDMAVLSEEVRSLIRRVPRQP